MIWQGILAKNWHTQKDKLPTELSKLLYMEVHLHNKDQESSVTSFEVY